MPSNYSLPGKPPGPLTRVVAVIAAVLIGIVTLMFSIVVFAIALAVGAVVWGWLWWKMRGLRKQMQQDPRFQEAMRRARGGAQQGPASAGGDIIDGEVIREVPEQEETRRP